MIAILDLVSPAATLVEALEPIRADPSRSAVLLDIDGTLAPIVRHAADAHVPEATRSLLIEIARRYRRRRLRQRPARQHRAPDRRDRHDRLRRQPRRRAAAPARHEPRGRPRARRVDRARARVRRARVHERAPAPARAQRGQGRDRRVPLARGARRGGGRAGGAGDRRAGRGGGLRGALGAQGARGAPAGDARQGPRDRRAAARRRRRARRVYVGDDTTDLDAFRGLRALVESGRARAAPCAWRSAPTKRRPASRTRPT